MVTQFNLSGYSALKRAGKLTIEKYDDESVKVSFIVSKKELDQEVSALKESLSYQSQNFEEVVSDLGKLL